MLLELQVYNDVRIWINLQDFHVEETLNNKDTLYRSDAPDANQN